MKTFYAVLFALAQASCVTTKPEPAPIELCLSSPQLFNNELECQTQDIKNKN